MSEVFDNKKDVAKHGNISLAIESYNDIFSSFDPRGYGERSLSDDFLNECKKAASEIDENIELRFMIEKAKRNVSDELKIRRRLKQHFQRHVKIKEKEIHNLIMKGIYFVIAGIIFMFAATYLLYTYPEATLLSSFFVILLEPAGWFSFWEGLDMIVFEAKKKRPDYEFYKKMSSAEIFFLSY